MLENLTGLILMTVVKPDSIPYEIIRSARRKKSAAIQIKEGQVQILVPQNMPQAQIERLIRSKTPWIKNKLNEQKQRPPLKPKRYVSGEQFSYLGRQYALKLNSRGDPVVKLKQGCLTLAVPDAMPQSLRDDWIQNALTDWYLQQAQLELHPKNQHYAKIIGVQPKSVTVKSYRSRWGSCSVKGDISYNWKLIQAPHPIIDYVVVHELCHILHHNHSKHFWDCVRRYIPDYAERRQWLKFNGAELRV